MTNKFTNHFDVVTSLKCKQLNGIYTFIQTDGLDEIYKYVEEQKKKK